MDDRQRIVRFQWNFCLVELSLDFEEATCQPFNSLSSGGKAQSTWEWKIDSTIGIIYYVMMYNRQWKRAISPFCSRGERTPCGKAHCTACVASRSRNNMETR